MDTQQRSALRLATKPLSVVFAISAGLLGAVMLFFLGAEFGRLTPHEHAAFAVGLPSNGSFAGLPTDLAASLNPDCYTFTGGTCFVDPCLAYRNAECREGLCECIKACTGADGACYSGTYPVVASGFTLTNNKYQWQKMYMPAASIFNQLMTTVASSDFLLGKDKFILHELPGSVAGHKDYFLTTERFPNYVAAIRATTGTAFSPFAGYEIGLYKEYSPDRLAVRVCSKGNGMVMIGSPGATQTEWFYIHHGSWRVYGWGVSNPGNGAVWDTNPAIPDGVLPVCE